MRLYAHAQFNFYIIFLCNVIRNIPLLSAVTEKRVSAPEAHKITYNKISGSIDKFLKPNAFFLAKFANILLKIAEVSSFGNIRLATFLDFFIILNFLVHYPFSNNSLYFSYIL